MAKMVKKAAVLVGLLAGSWCILFAVLAFVVSAARAAVAVVP